MKIKKVTVFGTGNFGARLAFHIAFRKIDVTVYDQDYGLLEEARTKFREFAGYYAEHFDASPEEIDAALANIAYSMDIAEAAGNAQLVIEALPEDMDVKTDFFRELKKSAPKNAIFATTSEGLDPEKLATASGRPEKFLNFHFTGNKDHTNTAEIVALPSTDPKVVEKLTAFAEDIGIVVTLRKLEKQQK